MNKILIVAAHPDDDILGCGGLMAKYSSSRIIRVVFIAEGTTCRYSRAEVNSPPAQEGVKVRADAACRALRSLGVKDVKFYDLPCGRLDQGPVIELNKIIESELKIFQPDALFSHSQDDVNNDHRLVSRAVQMATRPGGLYHVPFLYSFEVQSSTEWNFSVPFAPNHFEVLTDTQVRQKWEALAFYETEIRAYPHPRSYEGVETLARYRGVQAGAAYAEAYTSVRAVIV